MFFCAANWNRKYVVLQLEGSCSNNFKTWPCPSTDWIQLSVKFVEELEGRRSLYVFVEPYMYFV
jgi:hypothetical protein